MHFRQLSVCCGKPDSDESQNEVEQRSSVEMNDTASGLTVCGTGGHPR